MFPLSYFGWYRYLIRCESISDLRDWAYRHISKVRPKLKLPTLFTKRIKRLNRLLPRGHRFRGDVAV